MGSSLRYYTDNIQTDDLETLFSTKPRANINRRRSFEERDLEELSYRPKSRNGSFSSQVDSLFSSDSDPESHGDDGNPTQSSDLKGLLSTKIDIGNDLRHEITQELSRRPKNGVIYEEISANIKSIMERLKYLSKKEEQFTIEEVIEIADAAHLFKLLRIPEYEILYTVEEAGKMTHEGALLILQAKKLTQKGQNLLNKGKSMLEDLYIDNSVWLKEMGSHSCSYKQKLRKGMWSPEEDEKLLRHITMYGHGCWSSVPKQAGLQRSVMSCRLRWINYLRPDLKRGTLSQEENLIIGNSARFGETTSGELSLTDDRETLFSSKPRPNIIRKQSFDEGDLEELSGRPKRRSSSFGSLVDSLFSSYSDPKSHYGDGDDPNQTYDEKGLLSSKDDIYNDMMSLRLETEQELFSRPKHGVIYKEVTANIESIMERLKYLSKKEKHFTIDEAIEIADAAHLFKLLRMPEDENLYTMKEAGKMTYEGALLILQAEKLSHKGQDLLDKGKSMLEEWATVKDISLNLKLDI